MRKLLLILTGVGAGWLLVEGWKTVIDLDSTLHKIRRKIDELEEQTRELEKELGETG